MNHKFVIRFRVITYYSSNEDNKTNICSDPSDPTSIVMIPISNSTLEFDDQELL